MPFECLIMVFIGFFTFNYYCYLSSLNGNQVLQLQEITKAHRTRICTRTHAYYSHSSVFRFIFLSHFQVGYNYWLFWITAHPQLNRKWLGSSLFTFIVFIIIFRKSSNSFVFKVSQSNVLYRNRDMFYSLNLYLKTF